MRAFIGIDFDSALKKQLYEYQQKYRRFAQKGRWRNIDNFHITLKFFKEIGYQDQKSIDEAVKQICSERHPFELRLQNMGIFSGKDLIRTLWLGINGDLLSLHALQQEIDKAAESLGFPPENRRYTPHITIGQDIVFYQTFEEVKTILGEPDLPSIKVDRLYLFRSEQIQNRRVYTKVSEYGFR